MPLPFRRSLPIAGVAVLMTAASALADPPAGAAPHVRPEIHEAQTLLNDPTTRSSTAMHLVESIENRRVVVYIRHRVFTDSTLNGRIGLLRSNQPTRFLVLEVAVDRPAVNQLMALGHELQRAAEIAGAGQALDPAAFAAFYTEIGEQTGWGRHVTYETQAAREVSNQVRRELFGSRGRTTRDRQ